MDAFERNEPATEKPIDSVAAELQEEILPVPQAGPPRLPLTHRTAAKVTAFILCILMLLATAGSVLGAMVMLDEGMYTRPEADYRQMAFNNLAEGIAFHLADFIASGQEQAAIDYLEYKNVSGSKVYIEDPETGEGTAWQYGTAHSAASQTRYESQWYLREDGLLFHHTPPEDSSAYSIITATVFVPHELTQQDDFLIADTVIRLAYTMRYAVYGIGAAAILITIICFIFLLCASGRKQGLPDPQPGWGTKVPIDLLTASTACAAFFILQFSFESYHYDYYASDVLRIAMIAVAAIAVLVMALGWCMSFALRVKLGGWWKNSLCFFVLKLCWRGIKLLWRSLKAMSRGVWAILSRIPLVWKTALLLFGAAVAECIALVCSWAELDVLLGFWFVKFLLLIPLGLWLALVMRRLQKGGQAIAAGDLSYQVDTHRMPPDFRRHGENLNSIGQGMTAAVEQRLRSERMKTELITNVSHDIKTPLTSIINYADLISKEPCENETIHEYASVLHRQSDRLKRLIDDLVEASKASTGNLEVLLAPCEVGVLLAQTAGEYEQRLQERQLTLITTQPEQPIYILADGRRLWRVIDNLMNNICKYGQGGTRVYLSLAEQAEQAVITFRNTSREPLNLTADEFMERFVQGDSSRASDGNGLGLSIAKSLTELQNGTMELTVDGDLFKVILKFPLK